MDPDADPNVVTFQLLVEGGCTNHEFDIFPELYQCAPCPRTAEPSPLQRRQSLGACDANRAALGHSLPVPLALVQPV